jgi:hypothetical protein
LSFDYLVFSFYRSNEYYLVLRGVAITGTKPTGTLGAGVGTTIGAGTGAMIGFGTTIGAGAGGVIGFGTTIGAGVTVTVAGAAEAVVIKARIANVDVTVLIITFFSCVC